MINPDQLTKRYYKIGEVASMFDVATSLIRYWETEFKQLNPSKNKSGVRKYQKEDILLIDDIYELVKVKGYKLDGAKMALKNKTLPDRPRIDNSSKKHLEDIKSELESIKSGLMEFRKQIKKQQT